MFMRGIRLVPVLLLCVAVAAEAGPALPSATGTLSGPAINFGDQVVGTTSIPQGTTVTATVVPPLVGGPARIDTIGISNPEFAVVGGGTCQAGVTNLFDTNSCTVQVAFTPSARGPRSGTLSVNCTLLGAPGGLTLICNAASIALSGFGVVLQSVPALGREALTALAILLSLGSMYYLRRRKN